MNKMIRDLAEEYGEAFEGWKAGLAPEDPISKAWIASELGTLIGDRLREARKLPQPEAYLPERLREPYLGVAILCRDFKLSRGSFRSCYLRPIAVGMSAMMDPWCNPVFRVEVTIENQSEAKALEPYRWLKCRVAWAGGA